MLRELRMELAENIGFDLAFRMRALRNERKMKDNAMTKGKERSYFFRRSAEI